MPATPDCRSVASSVITRPGWPQPAGTLEAVLLGAVLSIRTTAVSVSSRFPIMSMPAKAIVVMPEAVTGMPVVNVASVPAPTT
jgi:hypothetical protein